MEIKRKKGFHWKLLLSGLFTGLLSADSFIYQLSSNSDYKYLLLGFLGLLILLSIFFLVSAIKNLIKKDAAIIISEEGITDNVSVPKLGFIPWEKISSCEIKKVQGANHLIIQLQHYFDHIDIENNVRRTSALQLEKKYNTPFIINSKLIGIPLLDLKKSIDAKIYNFSKTEDSKS